MAVQPLASQVHVAPACRALGEPRASFSSLVRGRLPRIREPRPTPARALCESERAHVLDVLASPRFVDRSLSKVVATLLDEGQYLCAELTMYRILAANQPVRERLQFAQSSDATPSPSWRPPAPTRPGPAISPGSGGPNAGRPSTSMSCSTSSERCDRGLDGCRSGERRARRDADRGNLSQARHRARGAHPGLGPRRDRSPASVPHQLLADLGVTRSLSRRQVNDDNPFFEAQFTALKYHPDFTERFEEITSRHRLLPIVLPQVQHRSPPCRDREAHPR